jgi:hypothetical protein
MRIYLWLAILLCFSYKAQTCCLEVMDPAARASSQRKTNQHVQVGVEDDKTKLTSEAWQNIFYNSHYLGRQHFLVIAVNPELHVQLLSPFIKLLNVNSECRITVVTSEKYHEELRRRFRQAIMNFIKPCSPALAAMRDLHFIDLASGHSSKRKWPKPLHGDKYTGILLAGPPAHEDYQAINQLLHITNSVLYIPKGDQQPDHVIAHLKEVGFMGRYMKEALCGMICASKSEFKTQPNGIQLIHNPTRDMLLLPLAKGPAHHNCADFNSRHTVDCAGNCGEDKN